MPRSVGREENRYRVPAYIWRALCKKTALENTDPREKINELIIDYLAETTKFTKEQLERTVEHPRKFNPNNNELITELLDTNELFNWD